MTCQRFSASRPRLLGGLVADQLQKIVDDKTNWQRLARAAGVSAEDFRKVLLAIQTEMARGFVEMGERSVPGPARRCLSCGGSGKIAGPIAPAVLDGPLGADEIIEQVEASRVPCPRCTPRGRDAV